MKLENNNSQSSLSSRSRKESRPSFSIPQKKQLHDDDDLKMEMEATLNPQHAGMIKSQGGIGNGTP